MPSSHSAVVTALATLMVKEYGPEAPITALTVIFACVVMYDAGISCNFNIFHLFFLLRYFFTLYEDAYYNSG